jgi:hypothetical protein
VGGRKPNWALRPAIQAATTVITPKRVPVQPNAPAGPAFGKVRRLGQDPPRASGSGSSGRGPALAGMASGGLFRARVSRCRQRRSQLLLLRLNNGRVISKYPEI